MGAAVNWAEVEIAFERNSPGLTSYLDRESGQVLVIIDGASEDDCKRQRLAAEPSQFLKLEPATSREQYRWMERFVATVTEGELRDRLLVAIDGKGAFRRFKDVLIGYPAERERWFGYRSTLLRHYISDWFGERDDCPQPPSEWTEAELPPEPAVTVAKAPGGGPAEALRRQVKALIDLLPAGELHSARVFLEYLRDRGSAEFNANRGKIDTRRPLRRRAAEDSEHAKAETTPLRDVSAV